MRDKESYKKTKWKNTDGNFKKLIGPDDTPRELGIHGNNRSTKIHNNTKLQDPIKIVDEQHFGKHL